MTKFSANLGFLWTDLSLPDAIRAAKRAGFDAVECHWPYDVLVDDVKAALKETGLEMLGLNTSRGKVLAGEMGLSALTDRVEDARKAIDQALDYAVEIDAQNIHVMAGFANGEEARQTYVDNLTYACGKAAALGKVILIEPLNPYDVPGYFLSNLKQAEDIIVQLGHSNLKLMFDCYHVQLISGDITNSLSRVLPLVGHIQFAGVPYRGEPDVGELSYAYVFKLISDLGYDKPLGAEYKCDKLTDQTLGWMSSLG